MSGPALALGPSAVLLALLALPVAAAAATLQVEVDGAEPGAGPVFVTVCQGGLAEAACPVGRSGEARRFAFDLPEGTYAVAAFQDQNGNGRLDRTGLGLPQEPYAFSGGTGRRARPDFRGAAFALREPGAAVRLRLARALPRR